MNKMRRLQLGALTLGIIAAVGCATKIDFGSGSEESKDYEVRIARFVKSDTKSIDCRVSDVRTKVVGAGATTNYEIVVCEEPSQTLYLLPPTPTFMVEKKIARIWYNELTQPLTESEVGMLYGRRTVGHDFERVFTLPVQGIIKKVEYPK